MSRAEALHGLAQAARLSARRLRVQAVAWLVPLWALLGVSRSYESYYPSLESRAELVASMRESVGTRLLYGVLPLPGTIGQLAQWEVGTWLLLCGALMAALMTCRVLRADEDEGLTELTRSAGAGTAVPFVSGLVVVTAVVALLGAGGSAVMVALTAVVDELTVSGALALGAVATVSGWTFMALAAVASQLSRTAGGARRLSLGALGLAFGLRVVADETGAAWLRWFSPLAWRDIVRPYGDNRWWPLLVMVALAALLVAVAGWLASRRELLGGYLPDRSTSRRRWRLRGHGDLVTRLGWPALWAWTLGATATAALFGAMSGGLTDLLKPGSPTTELVNQMSDGSPVAQFMSLLTLMTVMLAVSGAVSQALNLARYEREGLVELEAATGVRRTTLFLAQALLALGHGLWLLLAAGAALAAVTATQISSEHAVQRAFVFTITQAPGLVAALGLALALVGLAPRRAALVWAVVAWSMFVQFLGGLVRLPRWAQDLSVLGHHLDVTGPLEWKPLAVQLLVGVVGAGVGLWAYQRRDLGA